MTKLLGFKFLQAMPQPGVKRPVLEDDEVGVCTYYLQAISTILKYSTNTMLSSLATDAVVRGNERREQQMQSCEYHSYRYDVVGLDVANIFYSWVYG